MHLGLYSDPIKEKKGRKRAMRENGRINIFINRAESYSGRKERKRR